jgi:hypothetical protein
MVAIRILAWITRLSGLAALALGLLFWFAQVDWISAHVIFGVLLVLSLLSLSLIVMSVRGGRILAVAGILYALIVPIVGELQVRWYIAGASWLVPTIHMLLGVGAVGMAQALSSRYTRLKGAGSSSVVPTRTEAQAAR